MSKLETQKKIRRFDMIFLVRYPRFMSLLVLTESWENLIRTVVKILVKILQAVSEVSCKLLQYFFVRFLVKSQKISKLVGWQNSWTFREFRWLLIIFSKLGSRWDKIWPLGMDEMKGWDDTHLGRIGGAAFDLMSMLHFKCCDPLTHESI